MRTPLYGFIPNGDFVPLYGNFDGKNDDKPEMPWNSIFSEDKQLDRHCLKSCADWETQAICGTLLVRPNSWLLNSLTPYSDRGLTPNPWSLVTVKPQWTDDSTTKKPVGFRWGGDDFDDDRPGGDPAGATFEETLEEIMAWDSPVLGISLNITYICIYIYTHIHVYIRATPGFAQALQRRGFPFTNKWCCKLP